VVVRLGAGLFVVVVRVGAGLFVVAIPLGFFFYFLVFLLYNGQVNFV
jgi:hypothetical protein